MTFKKLQENRKLWVKANDLNDFQIADVLSKLYGDRSRFVYEILQNSEDAGATFVKFRLFDDRIEVHHNGLDFTLPDIDSITGIGKSTKVSHRHLHLHRREKSSFL